MGRDSLIAMQTACGMIIGRREDIQTGRLSQMLAGEIHDEPPAYTRQQEDSSAHDSNVADYVVVKEEEVDLDHEEAARWVPARAVTPRPGVYTAVSPDYTQQDDGNDGQNDDNVDSDNHDDNSDWESRPLRARRLPRKE